MDIKLRITPEDSAALTAALAASGERDAVYLTKGVVCLAALTLAMPFSASNEGGLRLIIALVLAYLAVRLTNWLIDWWRVKRSRWFPLPSVTGIEAGPRQLTVGLESVRDVTPSGERVFRWRAFDDAVETDNWIALLVSDRECLVVPRSALKLRGLAESEALVSLIGRGER